MMGHHTKFALAAAASLFGLSTSANASEIIVDKCASVSAPAGCLYSGNINENANPGQQNGYVYAQNLYNALRNPDITLNLIGDEGTIVGLGGTFTGAGTASGTWSLPGYIVDYVAVKASNNFVLYEIADSSGILNWDTFDIPYLNKNGQGNPHALSHMMFFGEEANPGAIPEPGTWALMILGIGAVGGALRRRRSQSVRYDFA